MCTHQKEKQETDPPVSGVNQKNCGVNIRWRYSTSDLVCLTTCIVAWTIKFLWQLKYQNSNSKTTKSQCYSNFIKILTAAMKLTKFLLRYYPPGEFIHHWFELNDKTTYGSILVLDFITKVSYVKIKRKSDNHSSSSIFDLK